MKLHISAHYFILLGTRLLLLKTRALHMAFTHYYFRNCFNFLKHLQIPEFLMQQITTKVHVYCMSALRNLKQIKNPPSSPLSLVICVIVKALKDKAISVCKSKSI